jgi:hypothetical protein
MLRTRLRIPLLLLTLALGLGAPGCGTDDAVKRDAEDARQRVDKEAGNLDERAKDAGQDAAKEAEKGIEDVDGQ